MPRSSHLERTSSENLLCRVCYRLIQLDLRNNPTAYRHPPTGILDLGYRMRDAGFMAIYWNLISAAKCNQKGFSLRAWRDDLTPLSRDRAIHKRTMRPR